MRIDAVHLASDDQALEDADVLGTDLGPAKEPVLSTQGDNPEGALELVGVDGDIRVGEKYRERVLALVDSSTASSSCTATTTRSAPRTWPWDTGS